MAATGRYLLIVMLAACYLPALAQMYPFITYTPKDGLPGSNIKNVFQDRHGRMFFMTNNGLSVYDGARFINYGREQGLSIPLVNDMLELGPDSFFIATNTNALKIWNRARITELVTADGVCPVINRLYKTSQGIFAAADQGFFQFRNNRFIRIAIVDSNNRELANSFDDIHDLGDYLLLKEYDPTSRNSRLFLWHKSQRKTISITGHFFISVALIPRFNALLLLTSTKLLSLNLDAAKHGKLEPVTFPPAYESLKKYYPLYKVRLDDKGNFWGIAYDRIIKISPEGTVLELNKTRGLNVNNIADIYLDRENILWILTNGSGVVKLVNSELEILTDIADQAGGWISALYAHKTTDAAYFFNSKDHYLYRWSPSGMTRMLHSRSIICRIQQYQQTLYLFDDSSVYKVLPSPGTRNNRPVELLLRSHADTLSFNRSIVDDQNFIFIPGMYIAAMSPAGNVHKIQMPALCDQLALDSLGQSLWAITRFGDVFCYAINRQRTDSILQLKYSYKSVIPPIHPRGITVTGDGKVWIGTSDNGVFCFLFRDAALVSQQHFSTKEGLTDNFIYYMEHDTKNNIWAGTRGGLDKIGSMNGQYYIDGIMRRNNVFQGIHVSSVGNNDNVWCLSTSGTALRINSQKTAPLHKPRILVSRLVTADSVWEQPSSSLSLPHSRNDIAIYVAAPSFVDEKQTRFSYLLEGSSSPRWSVPSARGDFNFINLPPATYVLRIRAFFSMPSYTSEELAFTFTIEPPWWKLTWVRLLLAIGGVALIGLMLRYYYRGKLATQRIAFEKQQAVEQERTRIAMEMHDDLGTGLTSIRYLAGTLSAEAPANTREKINKIDGSAKELIDAMNDIIWTIRSDNDLVEDVLGYIRKQSAEQLESADISYSFELPEELPSTRLSNDQKRNLVLIAKEAVHNIIKHSGASKVCMSAELREPGNLALRISDNGKGFNINGAGYGNGLGNMDKRARQINARLDILQGKGTTVIVQLDLTHTFG